MSKPPRCRKSRRASEQKREPELFLDGWSGKIHSYDGILPGVDLEDSSTSRLQDATPRLHSMTMSCHRS